MNVDIVHLVILISVLVLLILAIVGRRPPS